MNTNTTILKGNTEEGPRLKSEKPMEILVVSESDLDDVYNSDGTDMTDATEYDDSSDGSDILYATPLLLNLPPLLPLKGQHVPNSNLSNCSQVSKVTYFHHKAASNIATLYCTYILQDREIKVEECNLDADEDVDWGEDSDVDWDGTYYIDQVLQHPMCSANCTTEHCITISGQSKGTLLI